MKNRAVAIAAVFLLACGTSGAKRHYVLAEKLWNDGKYAASVAEFEKTTAQDPHGKLGLQALLRAANTQLLFLSQFEDAVKKFRTFSNLTTDPQASWEAKKQIGEIFFNKTDQYDQAISQYQSMIEQSPESAEVPEYLFRIGKSAFYLSRFKDAIGAYLNLIKKYPKSAFAEKAAYEIGVTYFTRGGKGSGGMEDFQEALDAYGSFIKKYPKSELVPEAQFGVAATLEEMDQLDAASNAYEALRGSFPSSKVIEIRLARIRDRKARKSH